MSKDSPFEAALASASTHQPSVTENDLLRIELILADDHGRNWEVLVARAYLKGVRAGLDGATCDNVRDTVRNLISND